MPVTSQDILKEILLRELQAPEPENSALRDPNTLFIIQKYAGLKNVLIYLMTPAFHEYITKISIVAPKPTTFKIFLHNGQFFFLQFMGKAYQATIAGKNYYLMNIGEKERCMLAIARILRFGNPLKTKGPEGAEKATRDEESGGEGGEGTPEVPEATPEEGGEQLTEIRILEEILKKKLNEDEESDSEDFSGGYKPLSVSDLKKPSISRDPKKTRGDDLLELIKNGYEFSLTDGNKASLQFHHTLIEKIFKEKKYNELNKRIVHFVDKNDKKYTVKDIIKTPELGGYLKGTAEARAKTGLNTQIQEILSKEEKDSITILVGNLEYKNINKAEKQIGVPKSDINLIDSDNKAMVFISHKDLNLEKGDKGYNDFASWGRLQTLLSTEPEIKQFAKQVESKIGKDGFKPATEYKNEGEETVTFFSKISDDLKTKIVFGKEYNSTNFGIDNVQVVIQGNIVLKKEGDGIYRLGGDKIWMSPKISGGEIPSKEWEPILQAHYRSGYDNLGIKNCEAWSITADSVSANAIPVQSGKVETFFREIKKDDYNKVQAKDPSGKIEDRIYIKKEWFDDPINSKFKKFFATKKEGDKTVYSIYDRSGKKYVLLLPKYNDKFKFL